MELTIGIQNKETTEAGTLIITMNPVNTSRWISTPELIEAEIAVQPYGVISVPGYEDLGETELMCYVTLDYVTYGAGLADLIAGSIGDEITFTATGTGGGGGGQNDAEITKWLEGSEFSLYDSSASFIASSAFYMNPYIKDIEFTEVLTVFNSAFYRASSLTNVSLPKVTTLASSCFNSCSNLETFDASNIVSIGQNAFTACSKLKSFYGNKVKWVGMSAFSGCQSLENINMPVVSSLFQANFAGCINLKSAIFGSSYTTIFNDTFKGCTALTMVSAPSASAISTTAFMNCTALSEINLPYAVSLSNGVFSGCTNLTAVHLGANRSNWSITLSSNAFYGCTKLESLYIENQSTAVGLLSSNAFDNTPLSDSTYLGYFGSIYVPASKVSAFKAATHWSLFADRITAIPEVTVT